MISLKGKASANNPDTGVRFPSLPGLSRFDVPPTASPRTPRPWLWAPPPPFPFVPLLCPLGHFLLSCLAAIGQAVRAAALGPPLWGQLLAELLQFALVHEPLLLKGAPLFFQVLFLQDLNHILNWVWWAKRQGEVPSAVATTGSPWVFLSVKTIPAPRIEPFNVLPVSGLRGPIWWNPLHFLFLNILDQCPGGKHSPHLLCDFLHFDEFILMFR